MEDVHVIPIAEKPVVKLPQAKAGVSNYLDGYIIKKNAIFVMEKESAAAV